MADLITSCGSGRNFRCARLSVQRKQPITEVEKTELNGQSLQGTLTAIEVNNFLKKQGMESDFPLFTACYRKSFLYTMTWRCILTYIDILHGTMSPEVIPSYIER